VVPLLQAITLEQYEREQREAAAGGGEQLHGADAGEHSYAPAPVQSFKEVSDWDHEPGQHGQAEVNTPEDGLFSGQDDASGFG
jgi:hypothetical protein